MGFSRYGGPGNFTQVKTCGLKVSAGQRQRVRLRRISDTCSQKIGCSRREDQNRCLTASQAIEQARYRAITAREYHYVKIFRLNRTQDLVCVPMALDKFYQAFVATLQKSALKFKDCIRAKTRARIVNDEGSHISSEDLRQAGISF